MLAEGKRDSALIRIEAHKQTVQCSYKKVIIFKTFSVGDWVLRKTLRNKIKTTFGNFAATWEGPYMIYDITP